MARRKRHSWIRRAARVALAATVAYIGWEALIWPRVAALAHRIPETTAFIERFKAEQRAVLVSEDINFFGHHGFEVAEIEAAVKDAIDDHEIPRGASTITQQVAKNLWLSPSRNPLRKVKEAILTWQLERFLDKKRILEIYLDVAEFGPGIYGAEAAQLAACLPNPGRWHPGGRSAVAVRRTERILGRMEKAQFLWKDI